MFLFFIAITLGITFWASRRTGTTTEFYSAGRRITGFQNGWAVAGDYMSAASFLGIAGLIAFYGYDGFMYSVGWLVAYLTVLLLVAEPLRNTGRFTMADVLAFRLRRPIVRVIAAASTLTVSLFYMIAQMVGAGSLVSLLVPGIGFNTAIVAVGALMLVYVIFGGMLATTWVQIVKAVLLMTGTILLSILVLARFHFSIFEFFDAVARVTGSFCADGVARPGRLPGRRRADRPRLHPAGPLLPRPLGRAVADVARHRADLRHRRPAAHPGALLHRALGPGGAHLGGLGDDPDRVVLHPDDVPRVRRRDAGGEGEHRGDDGRAPGAEPEPGGAAPGARGRRGDLPVVRLRDRVRHDPRRRRRPDHRRELGVRARHLVHRRQAPAGGRAGAGAGRAGHRRGDRRWCRSCWRSRCNR